MLSDEQLARREMELSLARRERLDREFMEIFTTVNGLPEPERSRMIAEIERIVDEVEWRAPLEQSSPVVSRGN